MAKENNQMPHEKFDPKLKFTFGLWTVGNPGRDPFGEPTREKLSVRQICDLLGEVGAYGVNFHDNDAVPIDATSQQAGQIIKEFKQAVKDNGLVVPMATTNLFSDPVFKDGAFTSNNARVRALAIQKTMRSMEFGAEMGAKIYVFWGGREGVESDATKCPVTAIERFREAINFLSEWNISQKFGYKFAFEAKPNEPRGHMYFAVTGSYLAFIPTLNHPEMCGVNPEVAHEHMAGLNFVHQVAAALEAGKLFHIDLNGQRGVKYDQDLVFGHGDLVSAFFLVDVLENGGLGGGPSYEGPRHFDFKPLRTEDAAGVWEAAASNMRTYLLLRDRTRAFRNDPEVREALTTSQIPDLSVPTLADGETPAGLRADPETYERFDVDAAGARGCGFARLDQLAIEHILGER